MPIKMTAVIVLSGGNELKVDETVEEVTRLLTEAKGKGPAAFVEVTQRSDPKTVVFVEHVAAVRPRDL